MKKIITVFFQTLFEEGELVKTTTNVFRYFRRKSGIVTEHDLMSLHEFYFYNNEQFGIRNFVFGEVVVIENNTVDVKFFFGGRDVRMILPLRYVFKKNALPLKVNGGLSPNDYTGKVKVNLLFTN